MRKVIDDTLIKLGEKKLNDHTVRQQLDAWIESKAGATAESRCYRHLGPEVGHGRPTFALF